MKRLCTIFFLFLTTVSANAQNNIFVLVDVSLSVKLDELNNAKQALNEVLTGSQLTRAFVSQGSQQDLVNFKIAQGDKLAISKFGSLQTTLAINPNSTTIQNVNADVSQVLNSASWIPSDGQTYLTLAKAKIAEYAKNNNIVKYKLYVISDNIQDDYGKGGKPNYPNDYTRNLAEGYNTSSNPVSESGYTKLKFTANSFFALSFSPNVDVSKYSLPGGNNANPLQPPISVIGIPSITFTSFADGKNDKPKPTNSNSFAISWTCNCPAGTTFNVALTEIDGGKFRDFSKKNIQGNSVKFTDIPSGKFKIVVTALNVKAAFTYIETPSGGYGIVIFLLILIIAGAIGYYLWNKKRHEKIEVFETNKTDDIFSKGNGGLTRSNSSNSDYF
jgi:hypothetical protein